MGSAGGMGDSRLVPLVLSGDERRTLENWVRRRSTAQGLALRARIVLACAQGGSNTAVWGRPGGSPAPGDKGRGGGRAGGGGGGGPRPPPPPRRAPPPTRPGGGGGG